MNRWFVYHLLTAIIAYRVTSYLDINLTYSLSSNYNVVKTISKLILGTISGRSTQRYIHVYHLQMAVIK